MRTVRAAYVQNAVRRMRVRFLRGESVSGWIELAVWIDHSSKHRVAMRMPVREAASLQSLDGVPAAGVYTISDEAIRLQSYLTPVDNEGNVAWVNQFTLPANWCVHSARQGIFRAPLTSYSSLSGVIYHILGNDKINDKPDIILRVMQRELAPSLLRHPLARVSS